MGAGSMYAKPARIIAEEAVVRFDNQARLQPSRTTCLSNKSGTACYLFATQLPNIGWAGIRRSSTRRTEKLNISEHLGTARYKNRRLSPNFKTGALLLSLGSPADETIATASAAHSIRCPRALLLRSRPRQSARETRNGGGRVLPRDLHWWTVFARRRGATQPRACVFSAGPISFRSGLARSTRYPRCRGHRAPGRHSDGTAPEQEFANRSTNLANRSYKYSR